VGKHFPEYPGDVQDGDEPSYSPNKTHKSVLGVERGTDSTRRIETDIDGNTYVHVAVDDTADSIIVSPLSVGAVSSVSDTVLTTIVTYTAASAVKITRISISGTVYAKFQLFYNTTLIETIRSGPDRTMFIEFKSPLSLISSDVLDVKVTHYNTGLMENFEATIYGA